MATSAGPATAVTTTLERTDVDKSIKALETVVTLCIDYCQMATTLANMNKKLAKALKESASIKSVTPYPGNALSAAAAIYDATSEVDFKYCRIIERELGAMNELKKWIKKLKKEDKALDEYTMSANAKIKNAGMAYEKKAKRRDKDAAEEHLRYTSLLSTLGTEMASAKHQHALFITSKHTATVYSISASVARVAESHWVRTCETLRKVAASVGPMAENRAYLEGGFMNAPPSDLSAPPDNPSLPLSISTAATLSSSSRQSDSPTHNRNVLTKSNTINAAALDQITADLRTALLNPKPQETEKQAEKLTSDTTVSDTLQEPAVDIPMPKSPALSMRVPFTASPASVSPIEPSKEVSTALDKPALKTTESEQAQSKASEAIFVESSKLAEKDKAKGQEKDKVDELLDLSKIPRIPTPTKEKKAESLFDPTKIGMASPTFKLLPPLTENVYHSAPSLASPPALAPKAQMPSSPTLIHAQPNESLSEAQKPVATPEDHERLAHRPFARKTSLTNESGPPRGNGLVSAMKDKYTDAPKSPPPPEPISHHRETPIRPQSRVSDLASRFNPPEQHGPIPGAYPSYSRLPPDPAGSRYPRAAIPSSPPPQPISRWAASSDNLPIRTPLSPPRHTGRTLEEFGILPPESQPLPLSLPSRDPRSRERERDRERDWREEELELEQRELELKLQRQRLLLARERDHRDREIGYFTEKDRYERDTGVSSSLRPPQRGYTASPLPVSPSKEDLVTRHSPGREFTHRPLDTRDLQMRDTPGYSSHTTHQQHQQQHGPGCQCSECTSARYGTQSPSSSSREGLSINNTGTTKERGWLGKGLKRLSMPLIPQSDPNSTRLRNSLDRNESAYSVASSYRR